MAEASMLQAEQSKVQMGHAANDGQQCCDRLHAVVTSATHLFTAHRSKLLCCVLHCFNALIDANERQHT